MHIELSPKFKAGLSAIIEHLNIEANITDSFNAGGETIILAADRSDVEKILEIEEEDFAAPGNPEGVQKPEDFNEIKSLIEEQLSDEV